MPRLQHMMNAFALNQCTGKNSAKFLWPFSRLEAFDIHASRQVIEFLLRESPDAKRVGRLLRKHEKEISKVVLLYETLPLKQQSVFPSLKARHVLCWCCRLRSPDFLLAAVA